MWLTLLWNNKRLLAEVAACILIAFALWWFVIHNPRVIKDLEKQRDEAKAQVESAHKAINLLMDIQRAHNESDKRKDENVWRIRNGVKPRRDGVFIYGGVQPALFKGYSS